MGTLTGWRRGIAAIMLGLVVSAGAGCDQQSSLAATSAQPSVSGPDPNGRQACAEFRAGWAGATDTAARLRLADSVERLVRRSDNAALEPPATAMGRSADDGDRAWRAAADDLRRACGHVGAGAAAADDTRPDTTPDTTPDRLPPTLPVTG